MGIQQGMTRYRRQSAPITASIISSMVVFAIVWMATSGKGIEQTALLPDWRSHPWSLLTYPWADAPFASGFRILGFLFLCMWIFFTGGSVERELGASKYLGVWLAMILLPALFIVSFGPVAGTVVAMGMWLPAAGMTLVWCMRNLHAQVMLYGVLPLSGRVMAWVTVAVVVVLSGARNPLFGLISGLHLAVAWAFASNLIPFWQYSTGGRPARVTDSRFLKKTERLDKGYYDDVKKREKEREERDRLRKMFESSLDDPDKDK